MATITTAQFGNSYCPQVALDATVSANTATTATISWTLRWVTHGYTVTTNGTARAWWVNVDGQTQNGSWDVNGKSSQTISSGTFTVNKAEAQRAVRFSLSFKFDFTWGGSTGSATYKDTLTADGTVAVGAMTSYTISFNANSGSGAPSAMTKYHGKDATLPAAVPTRANYIFKGWSTAQNGAVAYQPGATYSGNANATLYAVWEAAFVPPTISAISLLRTNTSDAASEEGNCVRVTATSVASTVGNSANKITHYSLDLKATTASSWTAKVAKAAYSSPAATASHNANYKWSLSADTAYQVRLTVWDTNGNTASAVATLPGKDYPIVFRRSGRSVGIGCAASTTEDAFDCARPARFTGGLKSGGNEVLTAVSSGGYMGIVPNPNSYIRTPPNGLLPYSTSSSSVIGTESWPFTYMVSKNFYKGSSAYPAYGARILASTATNGTVTLAESAANFTWIDIFFYGNAATSWNSVRVHSPNGKKAVLQVARYSEGYYQLQQKTATISGTSITFADSYYMNLKAGTTYVSTSTDVYVQYVVGWK